jgi:hypothetical protein
MFLQISNGDALVSYLPLAVEVRVKKLEAIEAYH